jgi:hypothetical protein
VANFAPDRPGLAGVALTFHNAAAADSFDNNGQTLLVLKNSSGGAITVTVDDPNSQLAAAQTFNPDVQRSIANGATSDVMGPFPPGRFNDANGRIQLAWGSTPGATFQWAAVSIS